MAKSTPVSHVLALDLGSTNLKAALFHAARGCVAEASVPVTYARNDSVEGDSRVELDGERIWQATVALIRETCARAEVAPAAIDRIAIASQAQTFALLDGDGAPLTPFVSWLDTRGAPYGGEIAAALGAAFHAHCSFSSGMAEMQLAKVLWFRREAPRKLDSAASVALLPAYIIRRLTGLFVTDPNLAGMSGLYSLRDRAWWSAALALCDIGAEQLPAVAPLGRPLRAQARCAELPLREDVEIVLAGNDQTAGAFGNGCSKDDLVATLGTALVAYRFAGMEPGPFSDLGCWGPYPGGGFYELGVRNHGCLALDWAREKVLPGHAVEAFMASAEEAAAARTAPTCVEAGCFYPERMATAEAWIGPEEPARRALAVLEGIGFSLRQLITRDLEVKTRPVLVTAIGGGSRSPFWLQRLADILGCPVRRGLGDARTGAAMLAITDVPSFVPPALPGTAAESQRTYRPTPSAVAHYEALYESWCAQK